MQAKHVLSPEHSVKTRVLTDNFWKAALGVTSFHASVMGIWVSFVVPALFPLCGGHALVTAHVSATAILEAAAIVRPACLVQSRSIGTWALERGQLVVKPSLSLTRRGTLSNL